MSRNGLLILLAALAGWIDALSFTALGAVFTSFQSGNFIFLGLAIDQGDIERLVGAGVSLAAFLAGSALGAYVVGRADVEGPGMRVLVPAFVLEWALLVGFAASWQAFGTPSGDSAARVALIVMSAAAMGTQGAAVFALRIPGVVTNAMTATLMLGGVLLGLRARGKSVAEEASPVSAAFLASMCASYVLSAVAVGAIERPGLTSAVPAALLSLALVCLLFWRGTLPGRSQGRPFQSALPAENRGR
jgi:uncharacterized membrane protein YoaK (UPF0700 family)